MNATAMAMVEAWRFSSCSLSPSTCTPAVFHSHPRLHSSQHISGSREFSVLVASTKATGNYLHELVSRSSRKSCDLIRSCSLLGYSCSLRGVSGLNLQPLRRVRRGRRKGVVFAQEAAVGNLPKKLHEIVKLFGAVPDPKAKYEQLLYYAKQLRPLGKEFLIPENKVEGCVSQVWVKPTVTSDNRVYFEAESDSLLTKGLAALLVDGLSGTTVAEVLQVTPDFVQMLGLKQSLTPSRSNGFLNMLKLMQKKTLQAYMEREAVKSFTGNNEKDCSSELAPSGTEVKSNSSNESKANTERGANGPQSAQAPESKRSSIQRKLLALVFCHILWAIGSPWTSKFQVKPIFFLPTTEQLVVHPVRRTMKQPSEWTEEPIANVITEILAYLESTKHPVGQQNG